MNWDFLFQGHDSLCVTTDSRCLTPGCIFVALKGEHFDGNDFVPQAEKAGAAYIIKGENALAELQDLARAWRRHLALPIIGITGTNGKTTTKELTAAVLRTKYNLHYTQGNYNNSLGVPLTLLQLTRQHELAIVEMGASHPGDIKELVDVAEPDYALITNVGRAHLQGFGSFEGVKKTKAELYDFIVAHKGRVFLNDSNSDLCQMWEDASEGVAVLEPIRYKGAVAMPAGTQLEGSYNAENIAAALTIGEYFGVSKEDGLKAVRAYTPTNNRSQAMKTEHNQLVVDAYNANPTSMTASVNSFIREHSSEKLTFILGEMRELGEYSHDEHQNIVNMLLENRMEEVYLVGEEYRKTTAPYPIFHDVNALCDYLNTNPLSDRHILVKGSRGNQLEKILPLL